MPGLHSWKKAVQMKTAEIEHKISIKKKSIFPGVRGLTISSCIVYDYTTSGPVEYISTVYTEYIFC